MVHNYYYFDKSTKRKNELREYYVFCDKEYQKILKYVNTRWLSLEFAVDRTLRVNPGLCSYTSFLKILLYVCKYWLYASY